MSNTQPTIAVRLLQEQIGFAHYALEETVKDVPIEIATHQPVGKARSIGSYYAHIFIVEDWGVNGLIQGHAPLFASGWREKTGFDSLPPLEQTKLLGWSHHVESDVVSTHNYAQAVIANTAAYLNELHDDDLARMVNLEEIGFGQMTVGRILSDFVLTNCNFHTGEISCLKGSHGLKGYPW